MADDAPRDEADDDVDTMHHEREIAFAPARFGAALCLLGRSWTKVSNRMTTDERFAFLARRSGLLLAAACASPHVLAAIVVRNYCHRHSSDRCSLDVASDLVVAAFVASGRAPFEATLAASAASAYLATPPVFETRETEREARRREGETVEERRKRSTNKEKRRRLSDVFALAILFALIVRFVAATAYAACALSAAVAVAQLAYVGFKRGDAYGSADANLALATCGALLYA